MAFFNWLSGDSSRRSSAKGAAKSAAMGAVTSDRKHAKTERSKPSEAAAERPAPERDARSESGKLKRHARRDQLYLAIREAMTHAGVLSSGYKFKVLSLDPRGNEFMVMVDLAHGFSQPEKFGELETQIIQHAKARFEITVPAVYWRMDDIATMKRPAEGAKAPSAPRYEPIQAEEVAAFKKALLAGATQERTPERTSARAASKAPDKSRQGPHSYTLLTGFEDTEMAPSPAMPALSTTQYGDLN
ncbi:hypothetical protein [Polaromonas sp. YR568]|uniref:hypothetical protein n=1 Tax=Polaromonas sp. YR568 TaxID=1855301 RepID=UPI003137A321